MTRTLAALVLLSLAFPMETAHAQTGSYNGPIIDVHLHAFRADSPAVALCPPFENLPVWDPSEDYTWETMLEAYADPDCAHPLASPATDDGVMRESIAAMQRHNVFGVLSGSPERVAEWVGAAPRRFIPGLMFRADRGMSTDSIRSLHERGALSVLGEVVNQYAGIAPDDERMAPYWTLAEELDIPVGIHIGKAAPGTIYMGNSGRDGWGRSRPVGHPRCPAPPPGMGGVP
jgi:uncharacterized protein